MATISPTSPMPVMTPPPGIVADLEHPPNVLHHFNIVAQVVCMLIAGTLFLMRSYVRLGFRTVS
jgi:hypothetical protein